MAKTFMRSTQLVALALAHCTLQGILVPLFVAFLNSSRNDKKLLRVFVIYVNFLSLAQTTVHLAGALKSLEDAPMSAAFRTTLLAMQPALTTLLSGSVQVFFIFRCWRIFGQRLLPIAPFIMLWFGAFVPGILLSMYLGQSVTRSTLKQAQPALAVWIFSSFALELSVTITTMVYLFRVRKDVAQENSVFTTVWQVTWASAAPMPILMAIALINGYLINSVTHLLTAMAVDITGKFYVLSLMITILGRGYIRAQFSQNMPGSSVMSRTLARGPLQPPQGSFAHAQSDMFELESRGAPASFRPNPSADGLGSTDVSREIGSQEDAVSFRSKPHDLEGVSHTHKVQLVPGDHSRDPIDP